MKKQLTIAALGFATLLGACKKNDDNASPNYSSKIAAEWTVEKSINKFTLNGAGEADTTDEYNGFPIVFKDGKVYGFNGSSIGWASEVSDYKISSDNLHISYTSDTGLETADWKIQKLTDNQLSIYKKETHKEGGYNVVTEEWINMKK